jgi:hypothetical protein
MSRGLFAERFSTRRISEADGEEHDGSTYDEDLAITVTLDGTPFVEVAPISSTDTLTKADSEPADTDREWDAQASTETTTRARTDRDQWGS